MKKVALVCCALALAGCRDRDVVAEVGSAKIRRAELDALLERKPAAERSREKALAELVERALLAEGARARGVAEQPAVRARVAASERETLAQALLDQVLQSATDEPDLRKLYEKDKDKLARRRVHVAQIFVQLPRGADIAGRDAARARAYKLYGKAQQGESWEALVRAGSDDHASAAKGGDLGPISEGAVDSAFFAAAAALKKGEIGKPLETPFGLHILRALEEVTTVTPGFAESRSRLLLDLRRVREAALLEELRRSTRVRIRE